MIGGSGNDIYTVDNAGDLTLELDGEGVDTVNTALTWTLGEHVENLNLTGASNRNGTGNAIDLVTSQNLSNLCPPMPLLPHLLRPTPRP